MQIMKRDPETTRWAERDITMLYSSTSMPELNLNSAVKLGFETRASIRLAGATVFFRLLFFVSSSERRTTLFLLPLG
jgi:hypothetical protein